MKFEFRKPGLLMRVLVAIALGVAIGRFAPEFVLRLGATFNVLAGQFLKFIVPLIIIGLVTPAIGEIGGKAGRLLLATVSIAYIDTLLAGLLAYGAGTLLFPGMADGTAEITYRYQPALLTELTDEPQLPEGLQGLLVEYAAARERSRFDAASQNAARMDLTLYRELKGQLKRGYPAPDLSRIYHIY